MSPSPAATRLARILAATTAVLLLLAGCGRGPDDRLRRIVRQTEPTGVKIAILAIDGFSPEIVRDQIRSGSMPAFARLGAEGSQGLLESRRPMKSPALWTTLATGTPREEHGIVDFVRPDRRHLVTSNDRRRLALWNLTSAFDLTNGWIGYWATWPAEPVRGYLVSDRLARTRYTEWLDGARTDAAVFPDELAPILAPLALDPLAPPMDEIDALVELDTEERRDLLAIPRPVFGHALSVLKFAWCAQRSHEEMALELLDREPQPDLFGLFLVAADPISHTFWHWFRPGDYPSVDPATARRLGSIVPAVYRHNDRFVGELLTRLDPETVVFVVSDHGFVSSRVLPRPLPPAQMEELRRESESLGQVAVGQSGRHDPSGFFLASGGPIRAGKTVHAQLVDLAPTVLALLGLPVPRDLTGRVLEEIVEPEFLAAHPVRYVDTYEGLISRPRLPEPGGAPDAEAERRMLDQLGALGYLSPAAPDESGDR